MAADGRYKGKGIAGSGQWGLSSQNESLQVGVDLKVCTFAPADRSKVEEYRYEEYTAFWQCTPKAWPYTMRKLQALGWPGTKPEDLVSLDGIDKNVVDIVIKTETYQGKDVTRADLLVGGVAMQMEKKLDPKDFAARVSRLLANNPAGVTGGGPAAAQEEPPF